MNLKSLPLSTKEKGEAKKNKFVSLINSKADEQVWFWHIFKYDHLPNSLNVSNMTHQQISLSLVNHY